jgi:hypothetical protein
MVNQIEEETGSLPPNLPRGVPPEVAQANPDVQAIIAPRLTMLMEIANSFLMTIIDSMDSVPYGIRWICKQIRSLTRVCDGCTLIKPVPDLVYSESTQKRRTMLFVPLSVDSSFCGLSTPQSSHPRRICWSMAFRRSTRDEL